MSVTKSAFPDTDRVALYLLYISKDAQDIIGRLQVQVPKIPLNPTHGCLPLGKQLSILYIPD